MHSASLEHSVELAGRALFSGELSRIVVRPAPAGSGIYFLRGGVRILARPAALTPATNCTVLSSAGIEVRVVEHLLCALWAAGIDQAEIEVESPDGELPNIDGSSLPFYEALLSGGRREFGPRWQFKLSGPMEVEDGPVRLSLEPAQDWTINYSFSHPELGAQEWHWRVGRSSAAAELLPSRTFATITEVEHMQRLGLMRNDDERAGLLVRNGHPLQALRFPDEYARHKVLDMLGDLYLLPFDWPCKVTASRSGHATNHLLSQKLAAAAGLKDQ